jgi:hypothetical protein
MPTQDPSYVRLVDRMARSTQVDISSGWSIAGLDVREFPGDDRPLAQSYVRDAIRRGTIEGCSKAEYEEVHGTNDHDFLAQAGIVVKNAEIEGHFQEAHVVQLAEEERHRIEVARGLGSSGISYGDDQIRRAALLRAQKAHDANKPADPDDEAGVVDPEDAAAVNEALEAGEDPPAPKNKRSRSKASASS